jgi:uncharacterized protein (TIGR00369 family)
MTTTTDGSDARRLAAQADAASGATFAGMPFARLLGLQREHAADGEARVRAADDTRLHEPDGCLGRALQLALLDMAMASAAVSSVGFTQTVSTLDLTASFIARRPGPLRATAQVVARDDRLCFCDAEVLDDHGLLVARGRGCFRLAAHA